MSNWEDKSFTSLLSSLSPDAHIRGKQFERVAKWWLTQDPIRSLDVKQAWLWDEWPERSGPDIGIDIVAEMFDGTLCAIQAKCFDEDRDIPKSELDSFVSAASHRTFQHRWLIATTDGLSGNARRMLDDQHVTRIMRSDLEESLDVWPTSIDELNPIPLIKYSPRPHQKRAVADVVSGLSSNSRGQLIMACGTGKTLTALWIKETLKPRTTLVLVPSLNLLAQTLAEWAKNTSSPWNFLCVCSDDTVNKADDQPISTVGDLPFDVTTNAEQISAFLSLGGEKIIFSTYQSSAQVAKAQELSGNTFDLVICDEAHRLTGKTDADYATVLDEKKIVAEKRLFMTATPRTYTTAVKTKAEERGVEITSMDDEHIYGPVLHKLSFGEAIKQELLSDYRVLIVGVTDPQVQDLIDRRELVSMNDSVTTDARTLAAHIGLAKATKDYNLKRTISFHSRIRTADQFARDHTKILEWLPESHKPSGETWTGTISGAMNTGDRRKLLTQLRLDGEDRHAILTNARCLTEGVDVPSLDGAAFIDPRSSQVDIIQAVGRAIRKSENKDVGTIVLPVLIPTDSDVEHALEDTAFKPIWAILNALKSHDDEFSVELNNLRTEMGRMNSPINLPNRIVFDLPLNIDILLPDFYSKFSIRILERTTETWEWWYGQLQKFVEDYGHSLVLQSYSSSGEPLGAWVNKQRQRFAKGALELHRIQKLEALPQWSWNRTEDSWHFHFQLLDGFIKKFGHSRVPQEYTFEGFRLGTWVNKQRSSHRHGRLNVTKTELLASISDWVWNPFEEDWERRFSLLLDFLQTEGHINVPNDLQIDEENLDRWIINQRANFNRDRLTPEQITQLESLPGWKWNLRQQSWEQYFDSLKQYVEEHGHSRAPQDYTSNGIRLGTWVNKQRGFYRNGNMSEDRRALLESLPGWTWTPTSAQKEEAFEMLQVFVDREGHARIPTAHIERGFALGQWVTNRYRAFRLGKMSSDEQRRLENIPGWSWTRQE